MICKECINDRDLNRYSIDVDYTAIICDKIKHVASYVFIETKRRRFDHVDLGYVLEIKMGTCPKGHNNTEYIRAWIHESFDHLSPFLSSGNQYYEIDLNSVPECVKTNTSRLYPISFVPLKVRNERKEIPRRDSNVSRPQKGFGQEVVSCMEGQWWL